MTTAMPKPMKTEWLNDCRVCCFSACLHLLRKAFGMIGEIVDARHQALHDLGDPERLPSFRGLLRVVAFHRERHLSDAVVGAGGVDVPAG